MEPGEFSAAHACLRCGATGGNDHLLTGKIEDGAIAVCGQCGNLTVVDSTNPGGQHQMTLAEFRCLPRDDMATFAITSVWMVLEHAEDEAVAAAARAATTVPPGPYEAPE